MGLEEGLKFKKKKKIKNETVKPKTVKTEKSTEGEVEVYGLEISTSSTNTKNITNNQNEINENNHQKLKIPVIKLKDI